MPGAREISDDFRAAGTEGRHNLAGGAGRSRSGAQPSLAGEFGAREWKDELGAGRPCHDESSRHARIFLDCSTGRRSRNQTRLERHSRAGCFPWSVGGCPFPVPEGRRRRLAGGKSAPADAAPRKPRQVPLCPSGASKKMVRDAGRLLTAQSVRAGESWRRCSVAAVTKSFFDATAEAWPVRRGDRGPRPLARACPRLISCGVPPGRKAKRWRQFFGPRLAPGPRQYPRELRRYYRRTGGDPAPPHLLPSHSFALNSPAKLGRAPERLRPTPPSKSHASLHARSAYAACRSLAIPTAPFPLRPRTARAPL